MGCWESGAVVSAMVSCADPASCLVADFEQVFSDPWQIAPATHASLRHATTSRQTVLDHDHVVSRYTGVTGQHQHHGIRTSCANGLATVSCH